MYHGHAISVLRFVFFPQAACLMECTEGGNQAPRIEVHPLIFVNTTVNLWVVVCSVRTPTTVLWQENTR